MNRRRKRQEGAFAEDEMQAQRNGYQGGQRAVWDGGNGMNAFAEEYTLILGICQSLKSPPQEGTHPRLGSPTDSG